MRFHSFWVRFPTRFSRCEFLPRILFWIRWRLGKMRKNQPSWDDYLVQQCYFCRYLEKEDPLMDKDVCFRHLSAFFITACLPLSLCCRFVSLSVAGPEGRRGIDSNMLLRWRKNRRHNSSRWGKIKSFCSREPLFFILKFGPFDGSVFLLMPVFVTLFRMK